LFLILAVLGQLFFSFYKYFEMNLDGDMPEVILPTESYKRVLTDPLGFAVLLKGETYNVPNRFFPHWQMYAYFRSVPLCLQSFLDPIASVFWSVALAKLFMHGLILYFLSVWASGTYSWRDPKFLLLVALISPLFQSSGADRYALGIIHEAPTYAIFYSFALAGILAVFSPLVLQVYHGRAFLFKKWYYALVVFFGVYLAFNGALNAPVLLIACFFYFVGTYIEVFGLNFPQAKRLRFIFNTPFSISCLIIVFVSLYSFYIGTFNAEALEGSRFSVSQRYLLLAKGLVLHFCLTSGPILLLAFICLNVFLLWKSRHKPTAAKLLRLFSWVLLMAGVYALLLPLGGYRAYRPYIVRGDTFLPITLGMMFFYGISTGYVLLEFRKTWYRVLIVGFSILFFFKNLEIPSGGAKERAAMSQLAYSKGQIVRLQTNTRVASWVPILRYQDSKNAAMLLQIWHITKKPTLFYSDTTHRSSR
jgi:hypothetical protein